MKKISKKLQTRVSIQPNSWWKIRANGLPIILAAMADYAGVVHHGNLQLFLLAILCLIGTVIPESREKTATEHKTDLRMRLRRSRKHTPR